MTLIMYILRSISVADPGFQVRGDLKKLRRAEGGSTIFGIFCVKNHVLRQKKSYLSNLRGGGDRPWNINSETY